MYAFGYHPGRLCLLAIAAISAVAGPAAVGAAGQTATGRSVERKQSHAPTSGLTFEVTYAATLRSTAIKGRVYVFLGPDSSGVELRSGPNWFRPQPFFAVNVENWKPDVPLRIDSRSDGFPARLDELEPGQYGVQAVVRLNFDSHKIGNGDGNAYGPVVHAQLDPQKGGRISLKVDHTVEPRPFKTTERIKLVELPSEKLSAFHHRPIKHRAAVILPKDMHERSTGTKLPTLYIIPGFGGDHTMASRIMASPRSAFGKDFIRVVLDPDCGTGHHVFADSATNGPRGAALVEEFIPFVERTFPALADPRARLLNGHSSGGWSSLWLQVTYPHVFGGTWSTSPDPVDFRDFQRINIYAAGENMFQDRAGKRRPIARIGAVPALYYDRFCRMDDVIGWGGQLGSFEAVFSPLDQNGRPRKLWDRSTGTVDLEVAKAWEAYDIRLVLERNWSVLGPKLKGKLHIIMGDLDTFYLEGAVKLLKESLSELGSDAVVEIVPNRNHATLLDAELARRLDREMNATVKTVRTAPQPAGE